MNTLFICSNDETICDGYIDDSTHAWQSEFTAEFVEAAARTVRNSPQFGDEVDYEAKSFFADWHGGKFDQFYQRCGLVAVAKDAPQWLVDLAWAADEAGCAARDKAIAEQEADNARFDAEENG